MVTPVEDTLYIFKPFSGGRCNGDMMFAGKHFERPIIGEAEVPTEVAGKNKALTK